MNTKNMVLSLFALVITALLTAVLVIWGYGTFIKEEKILTQQATTEGNITRAAFFARKKGDRKQEVKFVTVDNIIITLKGEGKKERYMQLELALAAYDDEEVKHNEAIIPAIRGATLLVLSNRDYTQVRAMPVNELRDVLLKTFEETLGKFDSKVYIHDLIISKLVFQ